MGVSVYLVFGDEEFAVSQKAKAIVNKLVPPQNQTFGLEVVDGLADNADGAARAISACRQSLKTLGFLGGTKVVWLKDANFLSDSPMGKAEAVRKAAEELAAMIAAGMPPDTILVISSGKIDKRFALYKACKSKGEVTEFSVPDKSWQADGQARERLVSLLSELGLRPDADALEVLTERISGDGRQMASEVEKLAVFMGGEKRVTAADVDALTSSSREALAWDLADAFGKKDLGRSLDILRRLLFQKESPIGLIILLQNRVRELLLYREALEKGWLREKKGYKGASFEWSAVPPDVEERFASDLGRDPRVNHPFRIGLLGSQAKLFSLRELRRAQKAFVDAHHKLVSSRIPQSMVLEMLLIRMLA